MAALELVATGEPEEVLRRFVVEQGRGRTEATVARYTETVDRLLAYLEGLEPATLLDPDDATLLAQQRGSGADFLSVLGFDALVRELPAFLREPWLPPRGLRRAGHRSLIDRLLVFLRREGLIAFESHRESYRAAKRAVEQARSLDYDWPDHPLPDDPWPGQMRSEGPPSSIRPQIQLVVSLPVDLVDDILTTIAVGEHSDVSSAVVAAMRRERWQHPHTDSMQAWDR